MTSYQIHHINSFIVISACI